MLNSFLNRQHLIFDVTLVKTEALGADAFASTFAFSDETEFFFTPSQYIWLVLPELAGMDPRGERRAFSIASSAEDTHSIQIMYRQTQSAYKQTLLNAQPGHKAQVIGPFGSSYDISQNPSEEKVLIAGGIGVAPFLSILRSSITVPRPPTRLIFTNVRPDVCQFFTELTNLTIQQQIAFEHHQGYFSEEMLSEEIDYPNTTFYICGSKKFVAAVATALAVKGVPFDRMHFEQFYPVPVGNLTAESLIDSSGKDSVLRQALEDSKNHVIITDANGMILFANGTAQRTTGYTFAEMEGRTPRLWGGVMSKEFYRNLWVKKQEKAGFNGEIINRRKNGELYHAIAHISPILGAAGNIRGYIGTEEDITDRVELEATLKEQNNQIAKEKQKSDTLLSSIGEGMSATDADSKIILINQSFTDILGWTEAEVIGKKMAEVIPLVNDEHLPLDLEKRPLYTALHTGQRVQVSDFCYVAKDKSEVPVEITVSPIVKGNQIQGIIEVFRDISKEKEIDKAKTEFVSIASHQLRTPLGITKWYLEALNGEEYIRNAPPAIQSYLAQITQSNERVLALVRDLLSVSRIDQGRVKNSPKSVDAWQLVKDLVGEMTVLAQQQQTQLTFHSSLTEPVTLVIDPLRLHEVVGNLISNALEFTPAGGQITVTAEVVTDFFKISVKDTGIGISPEDQKKLFTKFTRLEKGAAINPNGTGLGLYVVKSYVDAWGGKVSIESQEGAGATFIVEIPLQPHQTETPVGA